MKQAPRYQSWLLGSVVALCFLIITASLYAQTTVNGAGSNVAGTGAAASNDATLGGTTPSTTVPATQAATKAFVAANPAAPSTAQVQAAINGQAITPSSVTADTSVSAPQVTLTGSTPGRCIHTDASGNLVVAPDDCSTGTGTGTVTSFSAGNLSPLFTSSVATATTIPALTFGLSNSAANTVFGNFTNSSAAPGFTTIPNCPSSADALNYNGVTGWGCNEYITANTATTAGYATNAGALEGVSALPNGVSAHTQTPGDTSTDVANDAFVAAAIAAQTLGCTGTGGNINCTSLTASGTVAAGTTNPVTIGGATGSCVGKVAMADGTGCVANGSGSMSWPAAAGLAVYGGSSSWGTSVNLGTLTNTDWCTYTTANGLQCTSAVPQIALSLAKGTYVDGDMCTYASSGTLLNCNTAIPVQVAANLASSGATGVTGTLPASQVGSGYPSSSVTGLPTFPSGAIVGTTDTQALTGKTVDGVTPTVMGYVDPTSSIQTQLNAKQATLTNPVTGPGSGATSGHGAKCTNTSCTTIDDIGYVPLNPTTTVNGHALSSNVTVSASDVGNGTAQWNANQVNGGSVPASAPLLGTNSSNQPVSVTTLPTTAEPAHTGDATNSAGSLAMSVVKVNGNTPGGTCTNQFTRSIDSSGRPTCAAIAAADLSATIIPAVAVPTPGTSITLAAPSGIAICTGTCTVSVPVPAAGYQFCILNDDNVSTAITLSALGSSARYEGTARTAYGTAGTGTFTATAAAGNMVCIVGRDASHYLTTTYVGTWSAN